eukprot:1756511-Rhodomonas_salina.1
MPLPTNCRILRVLFTGGPHAGKTSMLQWLSGKLQSSGLAHSVVCVPESATSMIQMTQTQYDNSIFATEEGLL